MDKFLGIGLTNALGIALFTMLVSVMLKVIFTMHQVEGISEVVRTAQKGGDNMNKIFSVNFWVQTFVSTFITMLMIYFIKMIATKWNIPVVSDVAQAV